MVLCVAPKIINRPLTIFSDGNAANNPTKFYMGTANLKHVPFELTTSGSWNHDDETIKKENVRKMCAEVLAHNSVEVAAIQKIMCPNDNMRQYAENVIRKVGNAASHIMVEISTGYFFM